MDILQNIYMLCSLFTGCAVAVMGLWAGVLAAHKLFGPINIGLSIRTITLRVDSESKVSA